jgi:hypothetical protein
MSTSKLVWGDSCGHTCRHCACVPTTSGARPPA